MRAIKSNVDVFASVLTETVYTQNRSNIPNTDPFPYSSLKQAVAYFPEFCAVAATVEDCKQQVAALLAVSDQLTSGFTVNEESCTDAEPSTACLAYPAVESIDAHWLYGIMDEYVDTGYNIGTVSYKARGAGMIRGAAQYWRFGQSLGLVGDDNAKSYLSLSSALTKTAEDTERFPLADNYVFANPAYAASTDLTWVTALWRFMNPVQHDTNVSFTERNSPRTDQVTY